MSERTKQGQKSQEGSVTDKELLADLDNARQERPHDKLNQIEQKKHTDEKRPEKTEEALERASKLAEKADKKAREQAVDTVEHRYRGAPKKGQLNQSFRSQMKNIQDELGTGSRLFSKLIHNQKIEATSEFIGSTFARPNALLSGSIAAFITITVLFFIAKYYGFQLSGFETIGAFAIGWLLGILYDYCTTLISRNRNGK